MSNDEPTSDEPLTASLALIRSLEHSIAELRRSPTCTEQNIADLEEALAAVRSELMGGSAEGAEK